MGIVKNENKHQTYVSILITISIVNTFILIKLINRLISAKELILVKYCFTYLHLFENNSITTFSASLRLS